jgi:hypothetical protein
MTFGNAMRLKLDLAQLMRKHRGTRSTFTPISPSSARMSRASSRSKSSKPALATIARCCRPQATFAELSLIRAAAPMAASRWQSRTGPRTRLSSMPSARPARRSLLMRWSMTLRRC